MKVFGDQDQFLRNGREIESRCIATQRGKMRPCVTALLNLIRLVFWVCAFVIAIQGTAHSNRCLEFPSVHRIQKQNCIDNHSFSLVQGGPMLKVASPTSTTQNISLYAVLAEKRRDAVRRGISDEEWFLGLLTDPTLGAIVAYHRLAACTKCKLYGILAFETGEMYFFGKDGVRTKGFAASSWDGIDIKHVGDKRTDDIRRIFANFRSLKRGDPAHRRDSGHGNSPRSQTDKLIYKPFHSAKSLEITDALTLAEIPRAVVINALHAATELHKEFSIPFLTDSDALVHVSVLQQCFGHCSVFEATFYQDGRLQFLGLSGTRAIGLKQVRFSRAKLSEIQQKSALLKIFRFKDQYGSTGHDEGFRAISIRQDGKTKQVGFRPGNEPPELARFYEFIVNTLQDKQLY